MVTPVEKSSLFLYRWMCSFIHRNQSETLFWKPWLVYGMVWSELNQKQKRANFFTLILFMDPQTRGVQYLNFEVPMLGRVGAEGVHWSNSRSTNFSSLSVSQKEIMLIFISWTKLCSFLFRETKLCSFLLRETKRTECRVFLVPPNRRNSDEKAVPFVSLIGISESN